MAWRVFLKLLVRVDPTSHAHRAKFVVFMWPICGGNMDFSSQAGSRKVTLSENLLVVHVCGPRSKDCS